MAVVLLGAPAVLPVPAAGAATVGDTQAQIASVEAAIRAGAAQIHQLTMQFDQANLDAASLAQQVSADQATIARLQARVAGSQSLVKREAILGYTGGMGTALTGVGLSTDPSVRAEYMQVAAGNFTDAVDSYRVQQRQLASAEAVLARQEQASQAAALAAASARQQALGQASSEQAQLNQLQGQLGQLLAAAALAAAQQRQAAAQAAAARQAAAATPPAAPAQGLPVNNGLVTVVQTIVIPPVVSAPPPSTGYQDAGGVWLQLRECESSDNYATNTGNGYYGAYQFSEQTWSGLGYPGRPDLESHQMQDQAAMKLQSERGWGQWPACSAALGLT